MRRTDHGAYKHDELLVTDRWWHISAHVRAAMALVLKRQSRRSASIAPSVSVSPTAVKTRVVVSTALHHHIETTEEPCITRCNAAAVTEASFLSVSVFVPYRAEPAPAPFLLTRKRNPQAAQRKHGPTTNAERLFLPLSPIVSLFTTCHCTDSTTPTPFPAHRSLSLRSSSPGLLLLRSARSLPAPPCSSPKLA